jgi:hypothetical protein
MNGFPPKQNTFVQANSVSSQFSALTRDQEKFRIEKEAAERDHLAAQNRLQQLKAEQVGCLTKIRTAQEELGNLTRKQTMLHQEKARLGRVTECERKALEDCALHTKSLVKRENDLKKKYCLELGLLNDETADLLQRQVHKELVSLLSLESVGSVILPKLPNDVNKEAFDESFGLMKEARTMSGREASRHQLLKANIRELQATCTQTQHNMNLFYGPEADTEVACS